MKSRHRDGPPHQYLLLRVPDESTPGLGVAARARTRV